MNTKTTNQQLIGLAAPLVLGSMLQQLYNTADSMIIGRFLGAEAFAAAGVGGTVMNLFMFVLTGCCTGASVILAQVYGCGDHRLYRRESAVAVCAAYMHHVMPELFFGWRDFTWDFVLIHKTAAYGAVSALQQSSLYLGKLLVMGTVNTLGTETISGYTAAMRVEGFINSFGDSGAAASSVLIGQRFGAGKPMEVKDGMKSSMRLHLLSGGILALLMFASASPVICFLLNGTGSAASEGTRYVRLVAMFYLFNFIGCAYVGYFRGVGRLRIPTAGSTLQISVRVLLSCLLAPKMGLAAIALATGAGWIVAVIFHTFHYKTTAEPNPQKP